jgi:hypothetical protein
MSQLPPSAPESPAADTNSLGRGLFRQEGDYWTVGYGARVFRLKDSLGLSFISYLLRHPGIEFHVLDLGSGAPERELARDQAKPSSGSLSMNPEDLEVAGIHVGGLGDAGELLDEQAKAAYKARLGELCEECVAAETAKRRYANLEAAALLRRALDLSSKLPEAARGVSKCSLFPISTGWTERYD